MFYFISIFCHFLTSYLAITACPFSLITLCHTLIVKLRPRTLLFNNVSPYIIYSIVPTSLIINYALLFKLFIINHLIILKKLFEALTSAFRRTYRSSQIFICHFLTGTVKLYIAELHNCHFFRYYPLI